jgi:hypothetical protein
MPRPDFITNEKISEYDEMIDSDPESQPLAASATIREVCYAGLYLAEELEKLQCPEEYILRIQYTCGQLSFGRDPWEVHQDILQRYQNNELQFELDSNNIN